ncbi:hypothetical protein FLM9_552, partial [Candidatus Synechococcus spongiarum]
EEEWEGLGLDMTLPLPGAPIVYTA